MAIICRRVRLGKIALFKTSGTLKLPLSNIYVPNKLSLLEIRWSIRVVKKSSVNI